MKFATSFEHNVNFGSKQPSYSLDFVSTAELKLKKFEYKSENADLHEFYENDPKNYLFYNLIDVVLCARLNDKLKHIELHNGIRRTLKNSFSKSLIGNSSSFDSYVLYKNLNENKFIRYGMSTEQNKFISAEELSTFPKMIDKKKIIEPINIDSKDYGELISKFKGAHVNSPTPRVIKDGSLIIDLDASLPPWENILIKRNGTVSYGEIGKYTFKDGDETLTWTKDNKSCWRKVKGKIVHDWGTINGKLIIVTTETGKQVTVTDNHSIFGIQQNVRTSIPYVIKGKDLKVGDYVVGMKKFETYGTKKTQCPELLGFWLSDGWVVSGINGTYLIAKQDKSELDKYSTYLKNIRAKNHFTGNKKQEWMATVAEPYRTELKDFYIHSKRKKFIEILKYSLEDRIRIWKGMYDADGFEKTTSNQITPTKVLSKYREPEILECFIVAHTIGWNPRKFCNGIMNLHRYGPNLVIPEVFGSVKGYAGILSNTGISSNHRHPISKLENLLPHIKNAYSDEVGLEKIVSITEIDDYEGEVYDISVDETERFFAGSGIGVKNSSLYPNMMLQSNISFDVYTARIINPVTYKFLNVIENKIGKQTLDLTLIQSIHDLCIKYVKEEDVSNKLDKKRDLYYTCSYLLQKLFKEANNIEDIYKPKTDKHQFLLQFYLVPILDILSFIHPKSEPYNNFVYDYLFDINNLEHIYSCIYILEMPISTKQRILKLTIKEALEYISNYSMTIAGTCFEKHETKLGLFTNLLNELFTYRKFYQKKCTEYNEHSSEYNFYNSRQKSIKIIMNSIYGVLGLKVFRYSNHHLAQSITAQGQLSIKLAQYITENYLKTKEIIK